MGGKVVKDSEMIANYQSRVSEADDQLVTNNHVEKDVFCSIVRLFVRVKSFSFAKDIIAMFLVTSPIVINVPTRA